ncbi:peptidase [Azorhizobium oxalatiphilum]|uniref:Peptidase n=1 Tax=Azorhizobium oxalatiphilum TaxID=980631 RepID=A0A917F6A7_9HYPH|nr:PepSY domain-containing protein [Azorhizobium oxalatiphilum]GGF55337.1 peptidase [Azorhizobium oxalatiphilum]
MVAATTPATRRPAKAGWRPRLWKQTKHWLYWVHRWLGIASCLLFAMWFASGLVMMYVAYPGQSDAARRAILPPIAWDQVAITPADAITRTGGKVRDVALQMRGRTPVYRLTDEAGQVIILSAEDGRRLDGMTADDATQLARENLKSPSAALIDTRDRDQWTVAQGYNAHRPLHLIALNDGAGGEAYVSARTGEIVLQTTAHERFWNWLGAVPHWIYFTPLRTNGLLWANVVLWISGFCIAVAVTGIWIGILRVRLGKSRYKGGRVSPYRGWMLWHHISGLIGGIAVLTFIFSGWMSLNPGNAFTRSPLPATAQTAYRGDGGGPFPGDIARWGRQHAQAVEAHLIWFSGRPLVLLADARSQLALLDADGAPVALSDADIAKAAGPLLPGTPIARVTRLTAYDAYWYSHHRERPLPVVRVEFADDARTWIHIDPATSRIVGASTSSGRVYRWLYNGLHSLDLNILLQNRPAWDLVMWTLSLFGLVISVSSVVIGWRRLVR